MPLGLPVLKVSVTVLQTQKNFVYGLQFVWHLYDLFCTRPCYFLGYRPLPWRFTLTVGLTLYVGAGGTSGIG